MVLIRLCVKIIKKKSMKIAENIIYGKNACPVIAYQAGNEYKKLEKIPRYLVKVIEVSVRLSWTNKKTQ
ncbi:MAG TPA: hypothetical protein DCL40_05490 [Coxiellaceae bacterium]|nr:hypothetical protein [Coxiellaceae bacterium]